MAADKAILSPVQFALRGASILATSMGALAFISVSFIASTWESISAEKQHFAFVVVNASGAHFVFSLAFALPSVLICRALPRWSMAAAAAVGSAAYIYCALILQHSGLAHTLLSEPWVSIFPFGQALISLAQEPNPEANFYLLPLLTAWGVGIAMALIFGLVEQIAMRTARDDKA